MRLRLQNFRVFTDQTFSLENRTVIKGANGSGKSSVIEALRLLSVGKSFRTSRLDEVVRFEEPYLRIEADTSPNQKLDFFYGQAFAEQPTKERQLTVNGKLTSLLDWLGTMPSVLFVPGDVEIVMGMPQVRRRYIDSILWQVDPEFRRTQLELGRILKERSTVLFLLKVNRAGRDELRPWNELLVAATEAIRRRRQLYVNETATALEKEKNGRNPKFSISYTVASEIIEAVEQQEIKLCQNLYGPHRDEIEIIFQGRSARRYASRGQARAAVALLKAIEVSYLSQKLSGEPLVLLDDLLSELDQENAAFLFERLSQRANVIATSLTTNPLFKGWLEITL